MDRCRKCNRPVHNCQACNGGAKRGFGGIVLTCRTCNNTGKVCPEHDGHWK